MRCLAAAAALLALFAASAFADCDKPAPIRFAPGTRAAEISGGLARGERDCYTITARAGQQMNVTQPDPKAGNIVLQLYQPPWTATMTADGLVVRGRAVKGAEEGKDAAAWHGRLPASGPYLLVLGTTRGGGEYKVRVDIP